MEGIDLFGIGDVTAHLEQRVMGAIRQEITREPEDDLLNMNVTDYVDYLVDKYRIDPPILRIEGAYRTHRQAPVPGHMFPNGYDIDRQATHMRQVVDFHMPFTGDYTLLQYTPRTRLLRSFSDTLIDRQNSELIYFVVNFKIEDVEAKWQTFRGGIIGMLDDFSKDLDQFQASFPKRVRREVDQRRQQVLSNRSVLERLSVPLKPAAKPPALTVALQPRKVVDKPNAPSTAYVPEYALNEMQYSALLEALHKLGKSLESLPSTYKGKQEEALRDLLLMHLRLYFDSATGESLNKSGKTDILVSHEGGNVFVAECKFWKGKSAFLTAVSQLLSYLTWRDSKAALVLFVKNTGLQPVLDGIPTYIRSHGTFVEDRSSSAEGWFRFELHVENDETRPVHLTVLCFHLPIVASSKKG